MKKQDYTTAIQKAQQDLSSVRIEAGQYTVDACYYAFHNQEGNLTIVIFYKDGRAARYECMKSWKDILEDATVFPKRIYEYIIQNKGTDTNDKLNEFRLQYSLYGKPLNTDMNNDVISLELFVKIWGKKGKLSEYVDNSISDEVKDEMERRSISPHLQAQELMKNLCIEAEQDTEDASYYAFHNQEGNLTIIICYKDGRAAKYVCKRSWDDIVNDRIFALRFDERKLDRVTSAKIKAVIFHDNQGILKLNNENPITLEAFVKIWGRKGKLTYFEKLTSRDVAESYLIDKTTTKYITNEAVYYGFHEKGDLVIFIIYNDVRAQRYDCKGSWNEIINNSKWFWKRVFDYIAYNQIEDPLRQQMAQLAMNHILYHTPITEGMEKDDIINLELFMKIWGCKGKITEISPVIY